MKSRFYNFRDIMAKMECGKSYAYELIAKWNAELAAMGYATYRGKVPRKYADQKMYC